MYAQYTTRIMIFVFSTCGHTNAKKPGLAVLTNTCILAPPRDKCMKSFSASDIHRWFAGLSAPMNIISNPTAKLKPPLQ